MEITPYPCNPLYGVTRCGRVFRIVPTRMNRPVPYELKQRPDKDGYLLVGGGVAGTIETLKVHRMIAETFIPNPHDYPLVAHFDGVNTNNVDTNLRWTTSLGNSADMRRHGTVVLGEAHVVSKLTEDDVREARARAVRGESHTSIAEDMPVCRSVLSRAIRKDTWRHV